MASGSFAPGMPGGGGILLSLTWTAKSGRPRGELRTNRTGSPPSSWSARGAPWIQKAFALPALFRESRIPVFRRHAVGSLICLRAVHTVPHVYCTYRTYTCRFGTVCTLVAAPGPTLGGTGGNEWSEKDIWRSQAVRHCGRDKSSEFEAGTEAVGTCTITVPYILHADAGLHPHD